MYKQKRDISLLLMNTYQVALREQRDLLVGGGVGVGSWQAVACQIEFDEEGGGFAES